MSDKTQRKKLKKSIRGIRDHPRISRINTNKCESESNLPPLPALRGRDGVGASRIARKRPPTRGNFGRGKCVANPFFRVHSCPFVDHSESTRGLGRFFM